MKTQTQRQKHSHVAVDGKCVLLLSTATDAFLFSLFSKTKQLVRFFNAIVHQIWCIIFEEIGASDERDPHPSSMKMPAHWYGSLFQIKRKLRYKVTAAKKEKSFNCKIKSQTARYKVTFGDIKPDCEI